MVLQDPNISWSLLPSKSGHGEGASQLQPLLNIQLSFCQKAVPKVHPHEPGP
jgi:hypothetical protein